MVVDVSRWAKQPKCETCGGRLLSLRAYRGFVYVMKNKHQKTVKIGHTSGDPFERAKQLKSPGVVGEFDVAAFFTSFNPSKDEKIIHTKLAKRKVDKEHFGLATSEAIAKIRTILGRPPHFISNENKEEYERLVEQNKQIAERRFRKDNERAPPYQFALCEDESEYTAALE
jgi:hypothetical protein